MQRLIEISLTHTWYLTQIFIDTLIYTKIEH